MSLVFELGVVGVDVLDVEELVAAGVGIVGLTVVGVDLVVVVGFVLDVWVRIG